MYILANLVINFSLLPFTAEASSTIFIILVAADSEYGLSVFICKTLSPFIVPDKSVVPSVISTGMLSPVIAEQSAKPPPFITTASIGTLS